MTAAVGREQHGPDPDDAIERDVHAIAQRISELGAGERTRVYRMSFWADRMLDWAMSHPAFKTQLFRFVDVFPACSDDADVLRHLEEYLAGVDVPRALDVGLDAADAIPLGSKITAAVARRNVLRMAKQFIAGASPTDALPRLRDLWRQGEATTVDLLGEKTVTDAEAGNYERRVHELLDAVARDAAQWPPDAHLERDPWGDVPRVNVSVKPTALAPLYAPLTRDAGLAQAEERMARICEHAQRLGAAVYLDMEHYDVKDLTLELAQRICERFARGIRLGVVLQAYLHDCVDDLSRIVALSAGRDEALSVRLVKGAYWDFETVVARAYGWPVPVFERKTATDANYEACTRLLLDRAGDVRPAFATHNIRQIAYAIAAARARGLHDTAYEIQLLYGMAEPVHAALRRMGMRVRAYAPVGALVPGMAYLVRRLLENTANESFLRHRYAEGVDLEELLRPPGSGAQLGSGSPVFSGGLRPPEPPADPPAQTEGRSSSALGDFTNEPVLELRRAAPRDAMRDAVVRASREPPFDAPLLIGGRAIRTGDEIVSLDPGDTRRVVCRSSSAAVEHAELALEAARGETSWAHAPARARAEVLVQAAASMRARRTELAALEVFEAGKPWAQADADVCEAIDFCEYYAREALRLDAGARVLDVPGETNVYRYRPRGIAAVIAPWNFPLAIPCGMVTAALVCGNRVLFKPAEQTPGVGLRLVEILHAAGVPSGALAFLPGVGEVVGAHLVAHPDVSVVAFTGSRDVGLSIVRAAADTPPGRRHVKRVIAEMGGKNAIVVDTDADLDVAVPAIVDSAFGYAGQKCSAASRVIGVGRIFDELVERIAGATRLVPVGHAQDMGTVVGPLIDEDAFGRLHRYRDVAAEEGRVVLARDDVPDGGWYVGPTVAVVDDPASSVATDEIFGPLLVCLRADDFDHALAIANAPPYALTGGVFSRLPSHIAHTAANLRAGNIYVNRAITGAVVGRQPFGGFGLSGLGSKAGGPDYLLQFTDPVVVTENTIRQGFAPETGQGV